jgi:hypothetical protein
MKPFRQAYYVQMDDCEVHRYEDTCAANAMGRALNDHRGVKIVGCWTGVSGGRFPDMNGRINFEVPPHEAQPPRVKRPKKDKTCQLFDDNEILTESFKARVAAGLDVNPT